MYDFEASYLSLKESDWDKKIAALEAYESPCIACPRECKVDRIEKLGICKAPKTLKTSSINLHYGEEPPITGSGGSGTVFLSHCNLRCAFCQNYPISHLGNGQETTPEELGAKMVELQNRGAHNINFVSPTHYTIMIVRAIREAAKQGLTIPIVWNSNGYELVEIVKLLDNVVDVYLPDLKYSVDENAMKISRAKNYWKTACAALKEMYRQVGPLKTDDNYIATRGMLVRHLVLPNDMSGTKKVLEFLAHDISIRLPISLMAQYFPAYKATDLEEINRKITLEEYTTALDWMYELGFEDGYTQEDDLRFC